MNVKRILNNELSNSGKTIHLYHHPELSLWIAVHKSAYLLNRLLDSIDDEIEGRLPILNVPLIVLDEDAVDKLIRIIRPRPQKRKNHIIVNVEEDFDEKDYKKWVEELLSMEKQPIEVSTPVSDRVPKDELIVHDISAMSKGLKRSLDILFSGISIIVFSPLFLFCYMAIKKEDKGPAIYRQERIGLHGKPFNILKFRSMRMDAEKDGPQLSHSVGDSDSRLTKIGSFIRAHHLDELPQLWNVLVGEMSFIGPRPERKFFIDQILQHDRRYPYLYQLRPGVTSYATLYNGYTDTIEKMLIRLEYDLYYLSNQSLIFDSKVLLKTFLSIITGKKF